MYTCPRGKDAGQHNSQEGRQYSFGLERHKEKHKL